MTPDTVRPLAPGSVWLITGASAGLGLELAQAALRVGHIVVGTYRTSRPLADVALSRWVQLEVKDSSQRKDVVEAIFEEYGRIDVLVNNAGRSSFGVVEDAPLEEWRDLMEIHLLASVALTQQVLPGMRARRHGRIVMLSSMRGLLAGAVTGAYAASKAALEAMAEALAAEVGSFGVAVTVVEPGPLRTRFAAPDQLRLPPESGAYADLLRSMRMRLASSHGRQPGDPALAAKLIVEELMSARVPFRLPLGTAAVEIMRSKARMLEETLVEWAEQAGLIDQIATGESSGQEVAPR